MFNRDKATKLFRLGLLLTLIVTIIIAGCVPPPTPPPAAPTSEIQIIGQGKDWREVFRTLDQYRHDGIDKQNEVSKAGIDMQLTMEKIVVTAMSKFNVAQNCVADNGKMQAFVQSQLTGSFTGEAFNALVTQDTSGGSTAAECGPIYQDVSRYLEGAYEDLYYKKLKTNTLARDFYEFTKAWTEVKVYNDVLSTRLDPVILQQQLQDLAKSFGYNDMPALTGISWVPDDTLQYTIYSKNVCDKYTSGAYKEFMRYEDKVLFNGNEPALARLFHVTWTPPEYTSNGIGKCDLFAMAALYEYLSLQLSAATIEQLNGGAVPVIPTADPLPAPGNP